MPFDRIHIIGMHWLTVLFHHIVGDIDNIVDRTDALCAQAFLHPFRWRSDLDILYHSCRITWAEICRLYRHLDIIVDILVISCLCNNLWYKFFFKGCCCFSCNAKNSKAVYTVGCDLIFYNGIIQSQYLDSIGSHLGILRENINAVFRCIREHIAVWTQFFDRTHHTVWFYATQFALLDLDAALGLFTVMTAGNTSAI